MTVTYIFILVSILLLVSALYLLTKYVYYRGVVKQKGWLVPWEIKAIPLQEVDKIFETNEFGPTIDTQVRFIGRGHLNVPGGTSDAEAWVLAVLSKKAKNIFELGTCTGKTAYLMAANSPDSATVTTLTLPPEKLKEYSKDGEDSEDAVNDALNESVFTRFLYSGTPEEKKITQLFADSKHFDESPYEKKMDLIFVDGSHAYSYVQSDSEKALRMIKPGGIILWHDYRGPRQTQDVYRALNELSRKIPLSHIQGTSFIFHRAQ